MKSVGGNILHSMFQGKAYYRKSEIIVVGFGSVYGCQVLVWN